MHIISQVSFWLIAFRHLKYEAMAKVKEEYNKVIIVIIMIIIIIIIITRRRRRSF